MIDNGNVCDFIRRYRTLFWDFDGVIKESLEIKSEAFEYLFAPFGTHIATRVRDHHERHGGLSRYEKFPLYLSWAGRQATDAEVTHYCDLFSSAVRQRIIECAWVTGAREYLDANHRRQFFVLVTATPQPEMEDILGAIRIRHWFREVHGAPVTKADAIRSVLARAGHPLDEALCIGDSAADRAAARAAGVEFLLRRTRFNHDLQREYSGPQCDDFGEG
jgi:phosphoglycolate phosphatase-like HAD superfamily hydrolase